jgi:amidase
MMDRRSFLALGAGAAAAHAVGCAPMPEPPRAQSTVGPQAAPHPGAPRAPSAPHADLEEATIADLAARMQRGEVTSAELVRRYLERIEALDRHGPTLRSVIETNPEAEAIARGLDAERRARGPRGPLHGVPVLIKDNIDTGDRMLTSAGSLALAAAPAPADAALVARLRAAGAVILGKNNLSEWANIRSSRSTSGWSARGGLTRNPYALDRNASGSSSGSAVSVSANLAAAAIGTETDGSIVSPASICGIVGMKPTVGLVSRAGVVPIAGSQDTAGPMTRTVADAALLLAALAGPDPRDPATQAPPAGPVDYVKALDPGAARGKRVGVVRNVANLHAGVVRVFEAAMEDLKQLGATAVDVELPHLSELDAPEMSVLLHELKAGMARYLATRGAAIPHRSLLDLVRFNQAHAVEELRHFGQELFEQAVAKGPLDSAAYREALATCRRLARDEGLDAVMRDGKLDLLVAPTGGVAWMTDLVNGDAFTGSSSTPAAVAGYPSITVPAGALHGLPVGISFFGRPFSEALLLGVAHAYEQATRRRARPTYRATSADLP